MLAKACDVMHDLFSGDAMYDLVTVATFFVALFSLLGALSISAVVITGELPVSNLFGAAFLAVLFLFSFIFTHRRL